VGLRGYGLEISALEPIRDNVVRETPKPKKTKLRHA
jgi:hypothetical protein